MHTLRLRLEWAKVFAVFGQPSKDPLGRGQAIAHSRPNHYPDWIMDASLRDLDLPEGWTCWIELQPGLEGGFVGKAELRQGREQRCVFAVAQLPSREAVFERVKIRADHFIQEWHMRSGAEC